MGGALRRILVEARENDFSLGTYKIIAGIFSSLAQTSECCGRGVEFRCVSR